MPPAAKFDPRPRLGLSGLREIHLFLQVPARHATACLAAHLSQVLGLLCQAGMASRSVYLFLR